MKIKIIICLILLYSCTTNDDRSNCELILVNFSKVNKPQLTNDREKNDQYYKNWMNIYNRQWDMINHLMSFKGDTNTFVSVKGSKNYSYFGFTDLRTNYYKNHATPPVTNEVSALYLINSIYYNNYYFASNKIIYDTNNVQFDTLLEKLIIGKRTFLIDNVGLGFDNLKTNNYVISQAWKQVEKWCSENKGSSMEELRKNKVRPLAKTSLYWIGEEGGKINVDYKPLW